MTQLEVRPEALESLEALRPLTEDMATLERVRGQGLPPVLARIAQWVGEERLKGEQEGLSLAVLEKDRRSCWAEG